MSCNCTNHDHSDAHHCGGHNHGEDHHNCGHNHDEDHHCGGCCGEHEPHAIKITQAEREFLLALAQSPDIPLSRFLLTSTKSDHLESIALAPVYIIDGTESVAQLRERGTVLSSLDEKGLITLDYDQSLENFNYDLYQNSTAYQELRELVRGGKKKAGFLFDDTRLDSGSVALTSLGQSVSNQLNQA